MIDKKKHYKTRNGFPVKITKTDKQHAYGYFKTPHNGWCEAKWYIDGDFLPDFSESSLDLIEEDESCKKN